MEFLIGLVVGFFIGAYGFGKLFRRGSRQVTASWRGTQGVQAINAERSKHKEESLGRIMALFDRQEEIANNQVERLLNVSDATATNYLNELEEQGKIIQIGAEGRGVIYRKVGSSK